MTKTRYPFINIGIAIKFVFYWGGVGGPTRFNKVSANLGWWVLHQCLLAQQPMESLLANIHK